MVTDSISDMLTRLKNATMVGKKTVRSPFSKTCEAVAQVLLAEKYLQALSVEGEGKDRVLVLTPAYVKGESAIHSVKRISKPGVRIYSPYKELRSVLSGLGISVVSTSQGIMSNREAGKQHLGGEVLLELW